MAGTVFRATGTAKAVREFLASTHWKPCATYFRGQPKMQTSLRKSTVNGFNLSVSNTSALSLPAQVRSAIRFLGKEQQELARLHSLGLRGVLDFGVTSESEAMATFFRFPAELITLVAAARLAFEVSYYGVAER